MPEKFDISRRKLLASVGALGAAGAMGGAGSMAFFSDQEEFANNQLTAGELDLKVSWEEHYSDWKGDEQDVEGVRMVEETGDLADGEVGLPTYDDPLLAVPSDDTDGDGASQFDEFMEATLQEQFPDDETRDQIDELPPAVDPCEALADVPQDLDEGGELRPLIDLEDVKPGDFGEVTFDFVICDNPGYVWLNGGLIEADERGLTEPEREDDDEVEGVVELLDEIRAVVWYDDGDNALAEDETYVTARTVTEDGVLSSAVSLTGDQRIIAEGSLREVLTRLATGPGIPLDGIPTDDPRDCFAPTPTIHYVGFAWSLPVDHANEIQTDSMRFDVGFYTEQCRHNDGVGLSSELLAHYPLDVATDGTVADVSGNGYDGTVAGDVSFVDGQIGRAASFDGVDDAVRTDLNPGVSGESGTVAGWLKAPAQSISQNHFFLSNYLDRPGGGFHDGFFAIGTDDGDGMFFWTRDQSTTNSVQTTSYEPAFDGAWHHYAGVRDADADEIRFYIDGDLKETASFPGDVAIRDPDSFFGLMKHFDTRYLEGDVDDVRIYNRALSDQEVEELASL